MQFGLDEGVAIKQSGCTRRNWELSSRGLLIVIAVAVAFACGCKKTEQQVVLGPKSFATPESAGQTLYLAAKADDPNAMLAIFGPEAKEFLVTEDPVQDKLAFDEFAADYERMHRWGKLEGEALVLNVGVESYPFPFPLVKSADGQWTFSTDGAKKEFLARQIGDNELTVIDVLNGIADAQTEYFSTTHDGSKVKQYAQKFFSSEGKHDGLYWKPVDGEPESPLGPLAARADAESYKRPEPFHGYYYRILMEQGAHAQGGERNYIVKGNMTRGFAILAYPAEYRRSGVMTFMINQDRMVYQRDLGPESAEAARAIRSFEPDATWSIVE